MTVSTATAPTPQSLDELTKELEAAKARLDELEQAFVTHVHDRAMHERGRK